jgi:hypothetical protein
LIEARTQPSGEVVSPGRIVALCRKLTGRGVPILIDNETIAATTTVNP